MAALLRRKRHRSRILLLVGAGLLTLWAAPVTSAQDADSQPALPPDAIDPPAWPRSTTIWPAPDPFSVNGYDALQAMALMRREGLLVVLRGTERETVAVRELEAVPAGSLEDYPPGHRQRWDLLLNGQPLDWQRTYIRYGGELLNMQLLFTYRNQRPVPSVPFRLE